MSRDPLHLILAARDGAPECPRAEAPRAAFPFIQPHASLPLAMSTTATMAVAPTDAEPIRAETILRLFPDIDTTSDALSGHDEEQIRLMDEVCIVTDDNDMPIGKASKKICATPPFPSPFRRASRAPDCLDH